MKNPSNETHGRRAIVERLGWSDALLAELVLPAGVMRLTCSLTSGLTRARHDPPDVFWGVGDRGPNIKPAAAVERYGLTQLASHMAVDGAKIMPLPGEGPSLARFRIAGSQVVLESHVRLTTPTGLALSGLPPPADPEHESEPALTLSGAPLGCDADGADTEGIAALPDGRFWIAEEYVPSLLLVTRDGVAERRIVPQGSARFLGGSAIPVIEALPALAQSRKLNRGFEALALSPDGALLYVAFQSPLAHPDRLAHEQSDVVRIWALDARSGDLLQEFAYPLDAPELFRRDAGQGAVARRDIKVSELACLDDGSLLVLERATLSTRIHRVWPVTAAALPAIMADPGHRPTLEQLGASGMLQEGLPLLAKQLVLSTDDYPEIGGDLEGMIVLGPDTLLLANDSDYGTEGAETGFWKVTLPEPLTR